MFYGMTACQKLSTTGGCTITYAYMLYGETTFLWRDCKNCGGDTCPLVTMIPSLVCAHILWMYIRVFTHYNVKQKLNIVCV